VINFISNLPQHLRTGGFTARNFRALNALSTVDTVHYAGPIDPPAFIDEKAISKILRLMGSPGDFFFFSQRRLSLIARQVEMLSQPDAKLDFFNGFTPWILTRPARPYIAWNDCTFADYMDIFHRREEFRRKDLARIESAEAAWLQNARRVIFRSRWFAMRAIERYGLDPARVRSVSNFGEIELPKTDLYSGGSNFIFISTNFAAKGGFVAIKAIQHVRRYHSDAQLIIVGDCPQKAMQEVGVRYLGFLRKEVPEEMKIFCKALGEARALVHPTQSDTNPATLVEAGYFGCPVISSRSFAIPEVVDDGRTGLLLDDQSDVRAVANAMLQLLEDEAGYLSMRKAAWMKTRSENTREIFTTELIGAVSEVLDEL
jgi:glycosyltransferase involved in cell wall biosynthesis